MIAVTRDALVELGGILDLRVRTFEKILLFIDMTLAAGRGYFFNAWRDRAMTAMATDAGGNPGIMFLEQSLPVNTALVFVEDISGNTKRRHYFFIAMATIARLGDIRRIHRAVGIRDGHNVMFRMAIIADSYLIIARVEKFFAVTAGLVTLQLVRGNAVEIHLFHIRVATAADLGDLLLVRDADVARSRSFRQIFVLLGRITAMALVTIDRVLGMDARFHVIPHIGMACEAGIIGRDIGPAHVTRQEQKNKR